MSKKADNGWLGFFMGFFFGFITPILYYYADQYAFPAPPIECAHTKSIESLERDLKICFTKQDEIYDTVNKSTLTLIQEARKNNDQLDACLSNNIGVLSDIFRCNSDVGQCAEELNLCIENSF